MERFGKVPGPDGGVKRRKVVIAGVASVGAKDADRQLEVKVESNQQREIDADNVAFWDELCGTPWAKELSITDNSVESLRRYDAFYYNFYPYLLKHAQPEKMKGKAVIEIGLGYGTLGQTIAQHGADYVGMDISPKPVDMMKYRLSFMSLPGEVLQRSFLENKMESESFDYVVSIGCFHHTGSVQQCVDEALRLLKPGGVAEIMLYNRYSLRQWLHWPVQTSLSLLGRDPASSTGQRRAYDEDTRGTAPPRTEFSSIKQLRNVFGGFSHVRYTKENCDDLTLCGAGRHVRGDGAARFLAE